MTKANPNRDGLANVELANQNIRNIADIDMADVVQSLNETHDKIGADTELDWFYPTNPLIEPVEPIDFVVDGFCAKGMITIIGASPGAGKSMLVQYLFSKHADNVLPVKKGAKALYLTGADSSETELRRRARSIRVNDGLYTVDTPENVYCVFTNDVFTQDLQQHIIDGNFDVLIFDTVADYHEGSTYEAELVNKTMGIVRRFAKGTNCAVILITHTKKGSKIKTEYNVEDIADSRIFTSKSDFVFGIRSEYQNDSTNLIELQCLKSRSPRILPTIRASITYSPNLGLMIDPTERPFKTEIEAQNRDNRKLARVTEAHRLKDEGKTVREIAETIGVAVGTVQNYLKADVELVGKIHNDPESFVDD